MLDSIELDFAKMLLHLMESHQRSVQAIVEHTVEVQQSFYTKLLANLRQRKEDYPVQQVVASKIESEIAADKRKNRFVPFVTFLACGGADALLSLTDIEEGVADMLSRVFDAYNKIDEVLEGAITQEVQNVCMYSLITLPSLPSFSLTHSLTFTSIHNSYTSNATA